MHSSDCVHSYSDVASDVKCEKCLHAEELIKYITKHDSKKIKKIITNDAVISKNNM